METWWRWISNLYYFMSSATWSKMASNVGHFLDYRKCMCFSASIRSYPSYKILQCYVTLCKYIIWVKQIKREDNKILFEHLIDENRSNINYTTWPFVKKLPKMCYPLYYCPPLCTAFILVLVQTDIELQVARERGARQRVVVVRVCRQTRERGRGW